MRRQRVLGSAARQNVQPYSAPKRASQAGTCTHSGYNSISTSMYTQRGGRITSSSFSYTLLSPIQREKAQAFQSPIVSLHACLPGTQSPPLLTPLLLFHPFFSPLPSPCSQCAWTTRTSTTTAAAVCLVVVVGLALGGGVRKKSLLDRLGPKAGAGSGIVGTKVGHRYQGVSGDVAFQET